MVWVLMRLGVQAVVATMVPRTVILVTIAEALVTREFLHPLQGLTTHALPHTTPLHWQEDQHGKMAPIHADPHYHHLHT